MPLLLQKQKEFSHALIAWQKSEGRHHLPWQNTRDPYRVWLSEIMLQQTQVSTVIPYYQRFLERFPTVHALASAPLEEVLAHWSGLGYYARARNLHRAATLIHEKYGERFPEHPELWAELPGVGRSTAAAITAFSFGYRAAILDGNVKRVLTRYFGIAGFPGLPEIERRLWALAEALLPETEIEAYTQGLMDLGATLCVRRAPRCMVCPVHKNCSARQQGQQEELPTPNVRKALPIKAAEMLFLHTGKDVLLVQRPPSGIWGGLLCFPEGGAAALPDFLAAQGLVAVGAVEVEPIFRHTFTHFHWDIQLFRLLVKRKSRTIAAPFVWVNPEAAPRLPLPAPLHKILKNTTLSPKSESSQ